MIGSPVVAFLVTLNRRSVLAGSGDGARATAQPVALVSISFAGTGVKAPLMPLLSTLTVLPYVVHVSLAFGLLSARMLEPANVLPLNRFVPMIAKCWLSPSFGKSASRVPLPI